MSSPFRYAMILTHNRPEYVQACVNALASQVHAILVLDNASEVPVKSYLTVPNALETAAPFTTPLTVIEIPDQPPNIAVMWNTGLDYIERAMTGLGVSTWDVAIVCDDVAVPKGWFSAITSVMRRINAAAGCTHSFNPVREPLVKLHPDGDIHNRMQGSAFIVAGEKHQRADKTMHWWWCDTDMDFQARLNGGMVVAPGPIAHNARPNDFTVTVPGLAEQAGRDGEAFAAKWGARPW